MKRHKFTPSNSEHWLQGVYFRFNLSLQYAHFTIPRMCLMHYITSYSRPGGGLSYITLFRCCLALLNYDSNVSISSREAMLLTSYPQSSLFKVSLGRNLYVLIHESFIKQDTERNMRRKYIYPHPPTLTHIIISKW